MSTVVAQPLVSVDSPMPLMFREAMRRLAASVMIVTSRDEDGQPHGMVASSVISVSMEPASMLVAVNRSAGLYPVLMRSRRFCINLLGDHQHHLLAPFSQSALREQRFQSDDWSDAWSPDAQILPWLPGAPAVIECDLEVSTEYGTHTLCVGRVTRVHCSEAEQGGGASTARPLVWLAGQRAEFVTRS